MGETFVDFRNIKQQVTMEAVLGHYNIQLRRANHHSLRGGCPLPTHNSKRSAQSFGVDTGKNIWACQSNSCVAARQGKKGGNIIDFVAIMENCSIRDAALKLQEWFSITTSASRAQSTSPPARSRGEESKQELVAEREEGGQQTSVNKPLGFVLKDVDPSHSYLRQRGILEESARHFGLGFFPGKGLMASRVVIPIHNERGELVAYAGRSIDGAEPKYKLPTGFVKSAVLFNLHRVLSENSRQGSVVIIVEGFFDCLKVHQAGIPPVVALMGSSMSEEQQKLLSPFKQVILLLDGDAAGREGNQVIASKLLHSHFVKVVSLPDGKQPDQLSSEDLRSLLKM